MMKSFDKFPLNINKKFSFLIPALFVIICSGTLKAQDLFGSLPVSPTSYVTKSKIHPNGNIYITIWGAGVYRSVNKGATWESYNSGLTNLNLTDIEFISATEVMVSTMGGGIFKSSSLTNINWVPVNNGLKNLNVKAIKTYPNGWIFTGTYGSGIFVSKDKGSNWTLADKGLLYKDVTSIEIADNGWLVAGTYGGGIYISRDTSKSWTLQSASMKNQFINDIKRNKLGYLYAASNGRGLYFSVNDGIAWAELDTFMTRPVQIKPVPLPDLNTTAITFNKLYDPVFGSRYGGVYADDKEFDFTWIPTRITGVGVTTMCQNTDSMYCFSPNYLPHSTNSFGEEWWGLNKYPIAFLARNNRIMTLKEKELIITYNNYISKTTNDGQTWTLPIKGKQVVLKLAVDSTGIYYAATDSGLYKISADFTTWNRIFGTGLIIHDIEVAPNGTIFALTQRYENHESPVWPTDIRKVSYTTDGVNWTDAPLVFDTINFAMPYDLGINRNGHIYVGTGDKAAFSTDNGVTWTYTSQFPSMVNCFAFLSDNTVFMGTEKSGLYKSSGVNSFQKVSSYPADRIQTLFTSKNDYIYASGNNFLIDEELGSFEATYMSTNGGSKFININKDFGGEPVIAFGGNNSGDMYMTVSSGMIYRAIDKKNLTVPQLMDIPDKAIDVDVDAQFKWTTAKRAELYQLQISYDEDFIFVWEGVTQLDTVHSLYGKLEPNHKYFWRVRSKNHDAVSDWSEVRTFMSKLKTPTLISPVNKAVDVPVYAEMTWEDIDSATNYLIQISKKGDMSEIDFELNSDTNAVTSPLLEGLTEYFWRVKAKSTTSTSNWSVVWSFKTVFGPPFLISPADSSSGNAINQQMDWSKATDINEYDIQISEKEDFSSLIMDSSAIAANSVISNTLEYDKTYFWRVRSRKGDVVSEWSLMWRFRTGYSPVVLVSPENNAVNVPVKTEFKWDKHISQNKYEIEVAKSSDFSNNVIFESVDNLLTYTASTLEAYQEYFWRVRVISDSNTGVWSEPFKFKTQVGQIGLRFPVNQSENHPVSVNFLWFGIKGAVKYHLQIANDNGFNDLVFSQDTISNVFHTFSQLNPNSVYFWRVRAVSPEGEGEWSEVWQFKTGNNIPVLILPVNGDTTVFNPIKFVWAAVGGALKFELQVSENENFSTNAIEKSDITDNEYTTSELAFPKTYFWKIRAIMNEGPISWSQVWTFKTKDPSGVKDFITISESEIYPNPADKSVQIKLSEMVNSDILVKILDMSGKTVFSEKMILNNNILNLDCSGFNPGLYFLVIQSSDKMFKGEIIISR